MNRISSTLLSLLFILALACGTGPATGENDVGDDTDLDPDPWATHALGDIAVDPDESHVWVVNQGSNDYETRAVLTAVEPYGGDVVQIADVTNETDRWMLFTGTESALVMGQTLAGEKLIRVDTVSPAIMASEEIPQARYSNPRTSPSGTFVAARNGARKIDVIRTSTLAPTALLEAPEDWEIELAWTNATDQLLAVVGARTEGTGNASRVLRWRLEGGQVGSADIDIELPALCMNWASRIIAVSPNDRWAVFTLIDCPTASDPLVIVDLQDGSHRISSALGPVSFTPDSSTIVSHTTTEDGSPALQLLSVETLEAETIPLPLAGSFEFFVTHDGNAIVCSPLYSGGSLVLYDPVSGEVTTLEGTPHIAMAEFVSRPQHDELWLADQGVLYRLGLADASLDEYVLEPGVRHLNILPIRDRLILTAPEGGSIRRFDPTARQVEATIELPSPVAPTAAFVF